MAAQLKLGYSESHELIHFPLTNVYTVLYLELGPLPLVITCKFTHQQTVTCQTVGVTL